MYRTVDYDISSLQLEFNGAMMAWNSKQLWNIRRGRQWTVPKTIGGRLMKLLWNWRQPYQQTKAIITTAQRGNRHKFVW